MIPVTFVSFSRRLRPVPRWPLVLAVLWGLICVPLAYVDVQQRWIEPGRLWSMGFKLWLFWAAWAIVPLLWHAVLTLRRRMRSIHTVADWLWLLMLLAAAWASLIEPRLLLVHEYQISVAVPVPTASIPKGPAEPAVPAASAAPAAQAAPTAVSASASASASVLAASTAPAVVPAVAPAPAAAVPQKMRVAVVADIHLGLFVRQWHLQRLVDRLNALDVDAVLIPGDWVYEPHRDLVTAFAPLRQLRMPVFGVLGNHDTGYPGDASVEQPLRAALQAHGVQLLEGRVLDFQGWQLAGLGDLWGGQPRQDWQQLHGQWQAGRPRLLLAHQPDTAAVVGVDAVSLMVSGHTHGGQVWLPWVSTHWVLPKTSENGWYSGLYATPAGALFVTAGTGMVGLPLRFAVSPRIDVLTLTVQPQ